MSCVVLTADDVTRIPALGGGRGELFSAATQIFGDFAGRGKGVSLIIPEPAREIFIAKLEHADRLIALAEIGEQMGGRSFGAVRFADQSLRTVQRAGEIIEFVKIIVAIENFSRLVLNKARGVDERSEGHTSELPSLMR